MLSASVSVSYRVLPGLVCYALPVRGRAQFAQAATRRFATSDIELSHRTSLKKSVHLSVAGIIEPPQIDVIEQILHEQHSDDRWHVAVINTGLRRVRYQLPGRREGCCPLFAASSTSSISSPDQVGKSQ